MMWSLGFPCISLFYICLLIVGFFMKKNINNATTKIYSGLIITNFIGLILHIMLAILPNLYEPASFMIMIIARIYLIDLLVWFTLFTSYVVNITYDKKKSTVRVIQVIIFIIFLLTLMLALTLPLYMYHVADKIYTYGSSVTLLYLNAIVYVMACIYITFVNRSTLQMKRYVPLFVLIVLGSVVMCVQWFYPFTVLLTPFEAFMTTLMYFTIENPDVKMLEEFRIAKDRAEKANEEKEIFLYDITQDIRMPLYDIRKASSWLDTNADSMTKNSIHDGMHYIQNKTTNVLDKVNNVLDISNMELTNIKIYENKYDINNLVSYLKKTYKSSENVEIKYMVDSNIPTSLYGDVLRLKQLISILMDNAVKYTSSGTVFFKLNAINRKEITRLIITVEDTGVGIKASDIDNIFNKENRLYNNLDKIDDNKKNLAIAKSIASLLGGVLLLESEIGKGTKITLVIDQLIYKEQSKELDKLEEDTVKYVDKKKVLVVIEDDEYLAKIKSKLKKYDMEVEYVDKGAKCLDKIRLKNKYHLIIMDEQLKYLSSLEVLNRLKKVTNFNIPVCLLTDNIENDNFIKDGFTYLLDRKLDRKSLDSLFEEIEK